MIHPVSTGRPGTLPITGPAGAASSFKYVEIIKTRRKPDHSHPQAEILLVTSGSGTRIIGDTLAPFHAGDLFFLGSHLHHTFFPSPESPDENRTLVIQFDPEEIRPALEVFPEFSGFDHLLGKARTGLQVTGATRDTVASLLRRIGSLSPASPRRLGLFLAILAELSESTELLAAADPVPTPVRQSRMDGRLDVVCRLVQSHLANPLTQSAMAESVGMSPPAFSRWFKRNLGRPYTEHVNKSRMEMACRALLETDHDVGRIAMDLGFAGEGHFLRLFKSGLGVSPSAYRQLSRTREAAPVEEIISPPGRVAGLR